MVEGHENEEAGDCVVLYLEREMVWVLRPREAILEVALRGGTPILLTGFTDGNVLRKGGSNNVSGFGWKK